jgi:putative ubiquitin-RnfH superfamily antitoxin RatB of RatAB toxin-antitoxin module
MVNIEIIYAKTATLIIREAYILPVGTTVGEALNTSGLLERYPEIQNAEVGIFSKPVPLDKRLRESDRVEIYRPLIINPKDNRRRRAKLAKSR